MARLLTVVAGSLTLALPLERVAAVHAGSAAARHPAAVTLAAALCLPSGRSAALVEVRGDRSRGWLSVEAAGGTLDAPCLPLPPLPGHGGRALPFSALATGPGGPALVLDVGALLGELRQAPPGPQTAPAESHGLREGQPLLVCRAGPFSLRGRPLLLGLPLAAVQQVRPAAGLVGLPMAAPPLVGLVIMDGAAVPALSAAALAGLDAGVAVGRQTVLIRGSCGPLALLVEAALATEAPAHWAPAALLRPLAGPALAGAVARPQRWIAVIDPSRALATLPEAPVPPGAGMTFPVLKETTDSQCQAQPGPRFSLSSSALPS